MLKISRGPLIVNQANSTGPFIIREVWTHRELLYFLILRDIKIRYMQATIGAVWVVIQPLLMMFIFAVFFGFFIRVPTQGIPYLLFFYCGLVPWTFFTNAIGISSMSLVNSSHLITKVYFPRVLIPFAAVGAGIIDLLITSIILIGLAFWYRVAITFSVLVLPILVLLTVLLAFSIGMLLAALTAKYRDVRHALPFALQIWFFLTPIVYPVDVVPVRWRWIMSINPFTGIVEGIRASLTGAQFHWPTLATSTAVTLLICFCSIYSFRRIEPGIADLL